MLFSHQYSRSFLWFRIGAEPRRDLIAVTLRGFSQFLTELRRSEPSLRLVPSSQGTVQWLVSDSSPHSVFVCAFVLGGSRGGQTHHNCTTALVLRGKPSDEIWWTACFSSPSAYWVWLQRNWAPARAWAPWRTTTANNCFIIFTYLYKKQVFS